MLKLSQILAHENGQKCNVAHHKIDDSTLNSRVLKFACLNRSQTQILHLYLSK